MFRFTKRCGAPTISRAAQAAATLARFVRAGAAGLALSTLAGGCVLAFALLYASATQASAIDFAVAPLAGPTRLHEIILVANNWGGTADILDAESSSYRSLRTVNVVPDLAERMFEIYTDPVRLAYYLGIRQLIGEGHDQLVDDLYTSPDGRTLYVSRPSLCDVVAIDLATGAVRWRTQVEGQRADHMAISHDGTRLVVSASTANVVHLIDTANGQILGSFPSGDSPHENNYSADGSRIFHASIGLVYTPLDAPLLDSTKGERVFEIVDSSSLTVIEQIDMGQKLEKFGRPNMSAAVRPMALSPDESKLYFQVSFFHGFAEYDFAQQRITRVADLPISEEARRLRRDEYILDSAHHGIAMSGDGRKLCIAGTVSNYAAIVHVDDFSHRIHPLGARTYWATTSRSGRQCYVSVAGDDTVSVLSYDSEREIARVPVGKHPSRVRNGLIDESLLPY